MQAAEAREPVGLDALAIGVAGVRDAVMPQASKRSMRLPGEAGPLRGPC
jgi:hypothetical protein